MIGILALIAAVGFGVVSAYRLMGNGPSSLRTAAGALALIAAILGIVQWYTIGDSRWMVGGALMAAALAASFAGNGRATYILSLVLGDLGLILFVIALATGYHPA